MNLVGILLDQNGRIAVTNGGRLPSCTAQNTSLPEIMLKAFCTAQGIECSRLTETTFDLGSSGQGDKAYIVGRINTLNFTNRRLQFISASDFLARIRQEQAAGEASPRFVKMVEKAIADIMKPKAAAHTGGTKKPEGARASA